MLGESSGEVRSGSEPVFDRTLGQRVAMVVLGYSPLLRATVVVMLLVASPACSGRSGWSA